MKSVDRKPRGRTALDNGQLFHRAFVDGRSRTARRLHALSEAYEALLPTRKVSNVQRDLIRSIACLQVMIETREQDYANTGEMRGDYLPLVNGLATALQRLGINRGPSVARPVAPPIDRPAPANRPPMDRAAPTDGSLRVI
jgi:hypothetical protein